MTITELKNLAVKQSIDFNFAVEDDMQELLDDYKLYEEDFTKNWLHENTDWLDENGINEEVLNEMIGECIEQYSFNDYCSKLYLSDNVYTYMKSKLTEDSRNTIDYHTKVKGYEDFNEIVYHYLMENRDKENKKVN